MKKNVILFGVFVVLMSIIYHFEERNTIALQEKKERENSFFNIEDRGELLSLKTPGISLKKENDQFYVEKTGYVVEEEKLNYFFEILSLLRAKRFLGPKLIDAQIAEKEFFPDKSQKMIFTFADDIVEFTLGEKLQTAKSFYVKIKTKKDERWAVAYDSSPNVGLYTKEDVNNGPFQFTRVKSLFYLDESYFHDSRVFKKPLTVTNALIDKSYSLDLVNLTTLPSPKNLQVKKESIKDYIKGLQMLRGNKVIYPFDPDKLNKIMSTISLNNGELNLSLYHFYQGKEGHYLTINNDKGLFKLNPSAVPFFFTNIQDFWNKKVSSKKIDELKIKFRENKVLDIQIKKGVIQGRNNIKVKKEQVLRIINALKKEADYLTEKKITTQKAFDIELAQLKLKAFLNQDEIIFSEGVYNYHIRTDRPFSKRYKDYLE